MIVYKKGSIEYKIRATSINLIGIAIIIHYIIAMFNDVLRESVVWIVLEILFLVYCIFMEYDLGRYHPMFLQVVVWIESLWCMAYCLSTVIAIITFLIEISVLLLVRYKMRKKTFVK